MNLTARDSYVTFLSRPSSWRKGMKLKQHSASLHMVSKSDRCILSAGAPYLCGSKFKLCQISAFKGGAPNNALKVLRNSTKLKDDNDALIEDKVNEIPISCTSEKNESNSPISALHRSLKKWLKVLSVLPRVILETQQESNAKERLEILKVVWVHLSGLNSMIKIPLFTLIPLYLAVNVFYGAKVSRELMPLWIFGPFILAFYVKMIHLLFRLYFFSFNQSAKFIKNSPTYYKTVAVYIAQGKLKEDTGDRVQKLVSNIKDQEYEELSNRFMEKYLDFGELIWPLYCRTIRCLKRTYLI